MVMPDPFLDGLSTDNSLRILSTQGALPAIFAWREFAEAGGLMSYGTNLADSYRFKPVFIARFLKARNPLTCRSRCQPSSSS